MSQTSVAYEAAKILLNTKSVLFNSREPFVFTSGRISPVYTDCRRLISFPTERSYLTVAIGCTGGRHRSVYIVERLQERFRSLGGEVLCFHRELA